MALGSSSHLFVTCVCACAYANISPRHMPSVYFRKMRSRESWLRFVSSPPTQFPFERHANRAHKHRPSQHAADHHQNARRQQQDLRRRPDLLLSPVHVHQCAVSGQPLRPAESVPGTGRLVLPVAAARVRHAGGRGHWPASGRLRDGGCVQPNDCDDSAGLLCDVGANHAAGAPVAVCERTTFSFSVSCINVRLLSPFCRRWSSMPRPALHTRARPRAWRTQRERGCTPTTWSNAPTLRIRQWSWPMAWVMWRPDCMAWTPLMRSATIGAVGRWWKAFAEAMDVLICCIYLFKIYGRIMCWMYTFALKFQKNILLEYQILLHKSFDESKLGIHIIWNTPVFIIQIYWCRSIARLQ